MGWLRLHYQWQRQEKQGFVSKDTSQWNGGVSLGQNANVGDVTANAVVVEAVANHKFIFDFKPYIIQMQIGKHGVGLVQ